MTRSRTSSWRRPTTRRPAQARPGEYAALIIPTAPGDYTFHVTGKVEGVKVDLKVTSSPKTFSPVEDASAVQFPVKVPGTDQVAQRLDKELSRMVTADEVSAEVSSAKTLGYVGIAVGAVGVVLAAVALLVRGGRRRLRRPAPGSLRPRSRRLR